jgi:hypothetical protein
VASTYDVGDVARLSTTFATSGVAVDPSSVALTILTPGWVSTTYTYGVDAQIVKSATGAYYSDLTLTAAGRYRWRWVSAGTGAAATESWLTVRTQDVP